MDVIASVIMAWRLLAVGLFFVRVILERSFAVRQLIFCSYSHDIIHIALDAVSNTPIRLNRHSLNDGVNRWWIYRGTPLGTLWPVTNAIVHFKAV